MGGATGPPPRKLQMGSPQKWPQNQDRCGGHSVFRKLSTVQDFKNFECKVGRAEGEFLPVLKAGIFLNDVARMLPLLTLAQDSSLPFPVPTPPPSSSGRSLALEDTHLRVYSCALPPRDMQPHFRISVATPPPRRSPLNTVQDFIAIFLKILRRYPTKGK